MAESPLIATDEATHNERKWWQGASTQGARDDTREWGRRYGLPVQATRWHARRLANSETGAKRQREKWLRVNSGVL